MGGNIIDFKKAAEAKKDGKQFVFDSSKDGSIECAIGHDQAGNSYLMLGFDGKEAAVLPEALGVMLIQWMASLLEQDRAAKDMRPQEQHIQMRNDRLDFIQDKTERIQKEGRRTWSRAGYVSPSEYLDDVAFLLQTVTEQWNTMNRLTASIETAMKLEGGLKNKKAGDMLEDALLHAEIAGFY